MAAPDYLPITWLDIADCGPVPAGLPEVRGGAAREHPSRGAEARLARLQVVATAVDRPQAPWQFGALGVLVGDLIGGRTEQARAGVGGVERCRGVPFGDLDLLEDEGEVGGVQIEALTVGRLGRCRRESWQDAGAQESRAEARDHPRRPAPRSLSSSLSPHGPACHDGSSSSVGMGRNWHRRRLLTARSRVLHRV
jgi:hypothetical protein